MVGQQNLTISETFESAWGPWDGLTKGSPTWHQHWSCQARLSHAFSWCQQDRVFKKSRAPCHGMSHVKEGPPQQSVRRNYGYRHCWSNVCLPVLLLQPPWASVPLFVDAVGLTIQSAQTFEVLFFFFLRARTGQGHPDESRFLSFFSSVTFPSSPCWSFTSTESHGRLSFPFGYLIFWYHIDFWVHESLGFSLPSSIPLYSTLYPA